MSFPKPRRQERRSCSRVLSAFGSRDGPRNSVEGDCGSNQAHQDVERGSRVPCVSRRTDAPSVHANFRTTRSGSRGTENQTRRFTNNQRSPRNSSTSASRNYRDYLPQYNSRGFRSSHPIDRYRPSYRCRRRSPRDRRCRQRSSYSPPSRASYLHHHSGDYRPVYVDNSSNNSWPASGHHGGRSDYGPHRRISAHPKTYFTRGNDRSQTIARRRFYSGSPSPPYESRYPATSDYPLLRRSRSREPRSQKKSTKSYSRRSRSPMYPGESYSSRCHSSENLREPLRLSPYEPNLDLREPSDGDLHVGTSIQSRGRRVSEDGEVTPYAHNRRIDHQSVSPTPWRSPGTTVGLPREPGRMIRKSALLSRADYQVEAGGRLLGGGEAGGDLFVGRR